MRSYGQFCSIARSAEILCERWTMLLIRDLLLGSERFNELRRGVPLMSPTLLSKRLATLQEAGIVSYKDGRYRLTEAGRDLAPIVDAFAHWGARHIRDEIRDYELDAGFLMWAIRGMVDRDALPPRRCVVEVRLTDAPKAKRRWWLVAEDEVSLCIKDPGFEPDLWIRTDVRSLSEYFACECSLREVLESGRIRTHGDREIERNLASWLRPSPYPLRA